MDSFVGAGHDLPQAAETGRTGGMLFWAWPVVPPLRVTVEARGTRDAAGDADAGGKSVGAGIGAGGPGAAVTRAAEARLMPGKGRNHVPAARRFLPVLRPAPGIPAAESLPNAPPAISDHSPPPPQ